MAITPSEAIEGLALDYVLVGLLEGEQDFINFLSEGNQVSTTERNHTQMIGKDGNVLSTVDAYGNVVADADLAELADRSFGQFNWVFPTEDRIVLKVSHERMAEYGISNALLRTQIVTDTDIASFNQKTAKLDVEFQKLLRKVRNARRAQTKELLINLEAPVNEWQKAMGYAIVDTDVNRPSYFSYTNKLGTAALDATEFNLAVDLLAAKQLNIMNEEIGMDYATIVIHSESYTTAEAVFAPKKAVDSNQGRGGATLDASEAVGVYGDAINTTDWIVLGKFHRIRRMNWAGLNPANGIRVELVPASGRTYGVELVAFHHSIMVVDSPISIVKNCI